MDPLHRRPGRDRQHVIRDLQVEPRLIFGEDDGTRMNDRLARSLIESLNAGLDVEDPNPDEGRFLGRVDGFDQDEAQSKGDKGGVVLVGLLAP